jgi:exopolyphosphatase/pppGpp-phosphohydrolase
MLLASVSLRAINTQQPYSPTFQGDQPIVLEASTSGLKYATTHQGQLLTGMHTTFLGKTGATAFSRIDHFLRAARDIRRDIESKTGTIDPKTSIKAVATGIFRKKQFANTDGPLLSLALYQVFPELKEFRIISGQEEARFFFDGTYHGFVQKHPQANGKRLVAIDLGGTSTEICSGTSPKPQDLHSLDLGDSNHPLGNKTPVTAADYRKIRTGARDQVNAYMKNGKLSLYEKPDYLVWGFLQDQLRHYFAPILRAEHGIDLHTTPVPKAVIEQTLATDANIAALMDRCHQMLKQGHTQKVLDEDNLQNLPKDLAILLGLMDAFKAEHVYFEDHGGLKAGVLYHLNRTA